MLFLYGILIFAGASVLAVIAAVAFVVFALVRSASLLSSRVGRGPVDVVILQPGQRSRVARRRATPALAQLFQRPGFQSPVLAPVRLVRSRK